MERESSRGGGGRGSSHAIMQGYPCFTFIVFHRISGIQPMLPFRGKINRGKINQVNTIKQG